MDADVKDDMHVGPQSAKCSSRHTCTDSNWEKPQKPRDLQANLLCAGGYPLNIPADAAPILVAAGS